MLKNALYNDFHTARHDLPYFKNSQQCVRDIKQAMGISIKATYLHTPSYLFSKMSGATRSENRKKT